MNKLEVFGIRDGSDKWVGAFRPRRLQLPSCPFRRALVVSIAVVVATGERRRWISGIIPISVTARTRVSGRTVPAVVEATRLSRGPSLACQPEQRPGSRPEALLPAVARQRCWVTTPYDHWPTSASST